MPGLYALMPASFQWPATTTAHPSWSASKGISLLELLITLTLLGILAAASTPLWPSAQRAVNHAHLNQLNELLKLARSSAVHRGQRITLCGTTDGRRCTASWTGNFHVILFIDSNDNRQLDEGEELLVKENRLGGKWLWRGSGLRPYMRYGPLGEALDFGSFYLCPEQPRADGYRLRINAPGRTYRNRVLRAELDAAELCSEAHP